MNDDEIVEEEEVVEEEIVEEPEAYGAGPYWRLIADRLNPSPDSFPDAPEVPSDLLPPEGSHAEYRVLLDGNDILDPLDVRLTLLQPKLEMEINTAGSFEFVMPPTHTYYNSVHMFTSDIEIYEDGQLIWFGRPVEEQTDFYKQKTVYCEGALAYLNDTIVDMEDMEFDDIPIAGYFTFLLDEHNLGLQRASGVLNGSDGSYSDPLVRKRSFEAGNVTIDDTLVYRKPGVEKTFDLITGECLNTNGGYLFCRKENGKIYLDWLKDMPYTCNQIIEFGLNMQNYSLKFTGNDYATCILAHGKDDDDGFPITFSSVNNDSAVYVSAAASTYGYITKYVNYSDIDSPYKLLNEAKKELENDQYNATVIECEAVDLHTQNENYEPFRIGQMIRVRSIPHVIDKEYPLTKMSIDLSSAVKKITLGTLPRPTLTRIVKDKSDEENSGGDEYSGGGYSGDSGIGTGETSTSDWTHWVGTQAEYNAIVPKNPTCVYFIT